MTGATGPTGPTGPTGATGSTGATGATGAGKTFATSIGNGSATSFTVTHNLGTRDVTVSVLQAGSPYAPVYATWAAATTNTVSVDFGAVVPTSNQYRVVVIAV